MTQAQVETHGWPPGTGWRGDTLIATYDDRVLGVVLRLPAHLRTVDVWAYHWYGDDPCDLAAIVMAEAPTRDAARHALVAALRERGLLPSP